MFLEVFYDVIELIVFFENSVDDVIDGESIWYR